MAGKKKKGIALVFILSFIMVLIIAGASFMLISSSELRMVRIKNNSARAFYVAEAGLERARYDLDEDTDWDDGTINGYTYDKTNMDADGFYILNYDGATRSAVGGDFEVRLKDVIVDEEIWVKSKGVFGGITRTLQALIKVSRRFGSPAGVTSAIEAEGNIDVGGSGEVNGDVQENVDLVFEDVFGVTKTEMEGIAQKYYPNTYYNVAFNNDIATNVTWVNGGADLSQISSAGWTGDGILIVNGNLKITGGTFNGVIWVTGSLNFAAGNPTINGAIYVESGGADTTVLGNSEINYSADDVDGAFYFLSSLPPEITSWREIYQ